MASIYCRDFSLKADMNMAASFLRRLLRSINDAVRSAMLSWTDSSLWEISMTRRSRLFFILLTAESNSLFNSYKCIIKYYCGNSIWKYVFFTTYQYSSVNITCTNTLQFTLSIHYSFQNIVSI